MFSGGGYDGSIYADVAGGPRSMGADNCGGCQYVLGCELSMKVCCESSDPRGLSAMGVGAVRGGVDTAELLDMEYQGR
jgi:hypothetical protein